MVTSHYETDVHHYGVDLAAAPKESVLATLDGTVIYTGFDPNHGNVIQLQHKNGFISVYKHNELLLKEVGDHVVAGEAIALVGNTGELSTGPHLHFELWYKGNPVNPEEYYSFLIFHEKKTVSDIRLDRFHRNQALEVVSEHSDLFEVYALTANNQVDLLINQARKYMPEVVVIANERKYPELKEALEDLPIKVWAGADAIAQMVQSEPIDMVLTAMVGYSGLRPTISAIKAGKAIALANKETLVVAGELIMKLAAEHKVPILPVDSEHSAIFQCLTGAYDNPIEKILLTASGGPFRRKTLEELATVTKAQALRHPNWTMGAKITIDSASMMNKGFEMIEAKWLFDVTVRIRYEVVVHHSR